MLIESEGLEGLSSMAVGLIERLLWILMEWIYCIFHNVCRLLPRYHKARQEPSQPLDTDQNCCSVRGIPRCEQLFKEWDYLQTMWSIICDKGLLGEAWHMALYEMDCPWVLQQFTPLLWCVHCPAIRHDLWVGSHRLLVTWLHKLIYVKLYCSNLYEVNKGCL